MNFQKPLALLLMLSGAAAIPAYAQPDGQEFSLVFGMTQPILLRGFNAEINWWTPRFVVDYSHGIGLKFDGSLYGGAIEAQQLDLNVPHSLGFGFGYRFTQGLNLRLEPKLHVFQLYYDGEAMTRASRIAQYSTFTLGLGAYYRWTPFRNLRSGLAGLTFAPSVRYWPNVASTLENGRLLYENRLTGQTETHTAARIGVSNTPWIVNLSIGYTFR
jgi:long-subunit fatty acid transport protein